MPIQALLSAASLYAYQRATYAFQSPDQARIQTWRAGLTAARKHPVQGWGAGTWYQAYLPYRIGPPTRFAHDVFVQHAVELGAIGAVLVLLIVVAAVARGLTLAWRSDAADARLWLWVGCVAFLAQNLVGLTWYVPALLYLFWFSLGAVTADTRGAER